MNHQWLSSSYLLLFIFIHLISAENVKPPEIIEHPIDTLVRKNEPATLNCKANGNPKPTIHWYVNGQKVKINGHRLQWPNGALFFLQVQSGSKKGESDTGTYYCVASNDYGKARSRNASLNVAYIQKDFRVVPKSIQAGLGETAHLQCLGPKAQPEATIRWLKDGQPFIDSNGLNQPENPTHHSSSRPTNNDEAVGLFPSSDSERFKLLSGGTLRILNLQPKDNGRYSCVAENFVDTRESPPALLTVFVKPFFIQKPKNVIVMVNEPIELVCNAQGDPEPSISWSRKDTGKQSRFTVDKDNTLRIENAQLSDQDIYVCEASNQASSAVAYAQVKVHSSPQLINKPEDVKAQQGSSVRLSCSASGSPSPTVLYLRQLDFEAIQMLNFAPSSFSTILNQLTTATNQHPKSTQLEQPNVLFAGNGYSRMHVDHEGNLMLKSAKKDDEGLYFCCALNLLASTCASAGLLVLSLATPPLIYRAPSNQTLREDSVALIKCEIAIGQPGSLTPLTSIPASLQIQWLFNGSELNLSSQRYLQLESGTLQIHGVQMNDSGIYTCIGRNQYGDDRASSQLTVLATDYQLEESLNPELNEPDYLELPSSIYLIKATSNELTIKWNAASLKQTPFDSHLQIIGYQVSYFSATFADKQTEKNRPTWKSVFTPNTNLTIDNLEPNTGYVFVVRCQTKYGLSVPSSLSEEFYTTSFSNADLVPSVGKSGSFNVEKLLSKVFKLRKQLTYIQMQLLRAKPVNASIIRLIWQTNPSNALSTINGYLIYYREQASDFEPALDQSGLDFNGNLEHNDHSFNMDSPFHENHHHHNHHSIKNSPSHPAAFKLKVLNDSSLDSALVYDLKPFTTYEFFIIAYHSPYLLSMPSNIALGRTAEAIPIRSPSRIYLKVVEATYPPLISNQQQSAEFETDKDLLYSNSMFSSSESFDTNNIFKMKNDQVLADNYLMNKQGKRMAVEISWSHVPEIYWRGLQKAYRLEFQLIQSGQSVNSNLYSRLNQNSGSFQIHVASNIPQLIHNPANHQYNNTITLNNLTIGASYLLRISACSSAGCGLASPSVPLKMTPRYSYSLIDEPKLKINDNEINSIDKNLDNKIDLPNQNQGQDLDNTIVSTLNQEATMNNNKKDRTVFSKATDRLYLDQNLQTILICSAAVFVFFLLSFLLLLAILYLCKNKKLSMKNKTMNINSYIAVAKENCDKLNGQSQQMRLLAPLNIKKVQNGNNNLWSDSLPTSNTPISSNTSSARSRLGLPPIPKTALNSSQPLLMNSNNMDVFSHTTRSNFVNLNLKPQDDNEMCNGYAELETIDNGHHQLITKFNDNKNKTQFVSQATAGNHLDNLDHSINQSMNVDTTQPYATTTLMTFGNVFGNERELIQDGSSDQSIIGTNHLNSSMNSGSQQLQQHFQINQFKTNGARSQQATITNSSDSGSEVYGISKSSLRKLNTNGVESCSSIDSLTSNTRLGQARHLIEKVDEDAGYYHQPYSNAQPPLPASLQINNNSNNSNKMFQFLKSDIMRITTNSISSQSNNSSPMQTRSRFVNNYNKSSSSFTGSQLIEDGLQQINRTAIKQTNLGARQKSESNLIGTNKFSIVCNPIDKLTNYNQEDNEYNTFDNQFENKIKKYYQKTTSMNSDQLKSFLSTGAQQNLNNFNNKNSQNNFEAQSLIYDLVDGE